MKGIIEKIKNYKKEIGVALCAVIVVVVLVIIAKSGIINAKSLAFLPWNKGKQNYSEIVKRDDAGQLIKDVKSALENKNIAGVYESSSNYMTVKIATLADADEYKKIISGEKVGCDVLRMVDVLVPITKAPLNAAMKALFNTNAADYMPGNYVFGQKDLNFDKAVIENVVAKIYLTGKVTYAGSCDNPRLRAQIEATAKQFDTVKKVEIYVNGKTYSDPDMKG